MYIFIKTLTKSIPNELMDVYKEFNMSGQMATILYNKGLTTSDQLRKYISPSYNDLNSPYKFRDMTKAVDIISETISQNAPILIYGDYDVDGVCSLTILYNTIKYLGATALRFVPDRKMGYGLNMQMAKSIVAQEIKLVITVDNGITAINEIKYLRDNGVKVIVTDHHEPGQILPECDALIDAKCEGETYPFTELCGAGVALKLSEALIGKDKAMEFIDLAALATVADVVPLVNENRTIVKLGINKMNSEPSLWVKSLRLVYPETKVVNAYHLGYLYGPMINACGRLSTAKIAIQFLTEEDSSESVVYASKLKELNEKRKDVEQKIVKSLSCDLSHNIIIAVGQWPQGVVGLAASRITEKYNKPSIVFTYNPEKNIYTGSARSIDSIDLFSHISKYSHLAEKFGGHKMAAGMSVSEENFQQYINDLYQEFDSIDSSAFEKNYYYTCEASLEDLKNNFIYDANILEPCGCQSPSLKVLVNNIKLEKLKYKSDKTNGFFAEVTQNGVSADAVSFMQETINPNLFYNAILDYSPRKQNEYRILAIEAVDEIESKKTLKDSSVVMATEAVIDSNEAGITKPLDIPAENYGRRSIPLNLEALGISEKKISQFNKAGIFNSEDLINYFPVKYMDFRKTITADLIRSNEKCAIIGSVLNIRSSTGTNNCTIVTCTCCDTSGQKFSVRWFNQAYVTKSLFEHSTYIFCGTGYVGQQGYPSVNVQFFDRDICKLQTLIPIYKKITGMSNDYLVSAIQSALEKQPLTDYLEKSVVDKYNLINQTSSIRLLHNPNSETDIAVAQRRKVFDSLFRFNFILKHNLKTACNKNNYIVKDREVISEFASLIPYELTADQKSSIIDISKSMGSEDSPVNDLIQGDVGCGKTIIAYFLAAIAARNGFQTSIAAPTEVLARQHFEGIKEYAKKLGLTVALLTGTTKARERKTILTNLASGELQILIGTHAVFQKSVIFKNLGLAIIDEQHKFGVEQRNSFANNEFMPHVITMSATPIPRTLAMATFGDHIAVYNIKTKPNGRKDVITQKVQSDDELYSFIYKEICNGHQAYIVCPLIDESEKLTSVDSIKSAVSSAKKFFAKYPEVKISDISGRMKQEDIAAEINKFKNNESQILISTTIIEVGVNVPNATVIAIKSSERFGLAQAHQLRGRVGRGSAQSYCLLQSTDSEDVKADILCNNSDGFEIAKEDMKLRGTGDFIGTSQSGANKDVMLMLSEPDLYKSISELNDAIYENPARFALYDYLLDDSEETNILS